MSRSTVKSELCVPPPYIPMESLVLSTLPMDLPLTRFFNNGVTHPTAFLARSLVVVRPDAVAAFSCVSSNRRGVVRRKPDSVASRNDMCRHLTESDQAFDQHRSPLRGQAGCRPICRRGNPAADSESGAKCLSPLDVRRRSGILAVLLLALLFVNPMAAQSTSATVDGPTDVHELEQFLDGYFMAKMPQLHVPGAVVVVVKDGQIFCAKGYGFADLEKRTPVFPDSTVFRLISVSKPFTAAAALQLVDEGKLDLHADVNRYLRLFHIPESYAQPVTLANLLTHTAGFDDQEIGITARTLEEHVQLGPYLAQRMPPRVMPPGEFYSYSNHSYALAGYLVEVVSGVPFAQYVQKNIFEPLEMNHSSFDFAPSVVQNLAQGYDWQADRYKPAEPDFPNVQPAASMISSGADVGHFLIALLNEGRFGNRQILSKSATTEMLGQQFTQDPRIPGTAFGPFEAVWNDERILMHDGDGSGAFSMLAMLPGRNLGFFVACNAENASLVWGFLQEFLVHYWPLQPHRFSPVQEPDLNRFAGHYVLNRMSRSSIGKLSTLMRQWRVHTAGDGALIVDNPDTPPKRWVEAGPLLFRDGDGGPIAFREDSRGRITHFFIGREVFERLPWYGVASFQKFLFVFFGVVFAWAALGWPLAWFWRNRRRGVAGQRTPVAHAWIWAGFTAGANLFFLGGLFLMLLFRDRLGFVYGMPRILIALLCIPPITTALTIGVFCFAIACWWRSNWTIGARLHYCLVATATVLFIPFLFHWNLWGFHY